MNKIKESLINILHSPIIYATVFFALGWIVALFLVWTHANFSFRTPYERRNSNIFPETSQIPTETVPTVITPTIDEPPVLIPSVIQKPQGAIMPQATSSASQQ